MIVLPHNQVEPIVINYQGLHPAVHPRSFRSGFLIVLSGVQLFNDRIIQSSSSVWIPLSDIDR